MTLRATLRGNQRQTNQSHPIRPADAAERNRSFHLHLIRRDGRGGLFLPCDGRPATDAAPRGGEHATTNPISQKGHVA